MKRSLSILSQVSFFLFLLYGCAENQRPMLPSVAGTAYDVLVVMPKYQWEGVLGDTMRSLLAYPIPYFPQREPILTLRHVPPDGFKGIFQTYRNVVIVSIGNQYDKSRLLLSRDVSAKTQLIYELQAPNQAGIIDLLVQNNEKIVNSILNTERLRTVELNRKYYDKNIHDKLLKNHSLTLAIPQGFAIQVDTGNFVWIEQMRGDNILGLLIWTYPYKDTLQLSKQALLAKRNEILRRNVPGKDPGSYMTTEKILDPLFDVNKLGNQVFYQLSGLWTVEKGFMGGPFINVTTVDHARKRIVTVDGFVFAPNQQKRNWLFQLEAIAYTLAFPK